MSFINSIYKLFGYNVGLIEKELEIKRFAARLDDCLKNPSDFTKDNLKTFLNSTTLLHKQNFFHYIFEKGDANTIKALLDKIESLQSDLEPLEQKQLKRLANAWDSHGTKPMYYLSQVEGFAKKVNNKSELESKFTILGATSLQKDQAWYEADQKTSKQAIKISIAVFLVYFVAKWGAGQAQQGQYTNLILVLSKIPALLECLVVTFYCIVGFKSNFAHPPHDAKGYKECKSWRETEYKRIANLEVESGAAVSA